VQGSASPVVTGVVSADNNTQAVTLTVDGNFEVSLNKVNWASSIMLDPTGENFYVRLKSTATTGYFEGTLTASVGDVRAYADVQGTVQTRLGDVNRDGSVSIGDVTALIDYLLGGDASSVDTAAADVNEDHSISIGDVTALIDLLLSGTSSMNAPQWDAMPTAGGIYIENLANNEVLEVYDIDGNLQAEVKSMGNHNVELPAGIYLVSGDTRSRKVVVK